MPLLFNTLLDQFEIDPAAVLLVRHQEHRSGGRGPYNLWRDDRPMFEAYQSRQGIAKRPIFSRAKFWASFVATPQSETLFTGLYASRYGGELKEDCPHPLGGVDKVGEVDCYEQSRDPRMMEFEGRLVIDWGTGFRQWTQWAENRNKPIIELRRAFREPDFPGFTQFIQLLSQVTVLPPGWVEVLKNSRGVYLLTCPRTKEQYVGSAYGADGFWGRWIVYAANSHGGNVGLKSREVSDYQVSILEVAGSNATQNDIVQAEEHWKRKLQSREMGLNR